jgi:ribosomal-protein-alanine N-acetyltransferase
MSALWRDSPEPAGMPALRPMTTAHLDAVMAIEAAAYAFPWTRGNFIDSLAAGYPARVLIDERGKTLGYFVAMEGVEEMHLLNITVAPPMQSRGYARSMLEALGGLCRERGAAELWLEVRSSNARARAMYERLGFIAAGVRKGYYPAPFGRREDAIVMRLKIDRPEPGAVDAVD